MTEHDDAYNADISAAETTAQGMRHAHTGLGRVLWLLTEGIATALGIMADVKAKVTTLHDAGPVDLGPVMLRLDAIEQNAGARAMSLGRSIDAALIVAHENSIDLKRIVAFINGLEDAGPATHGRIALNGVFGRETGENTMASEILDSAPPAKLTVEWTDAKGAPADGVTDAWSDDAGMVADNGDGTGTFTPGMPGVSNVKVIGTNADGTTVELTDVIVVKSGDAVAGTITLTPGA